MKWLLVFLCVLFVSPFLIADDDSKQDEKIKLSSVSVSPGFFSPSISPCGFSDTYSIKSSDGLKQDDKSPEHKFFVKQTITISSSGQAGVVLKTISTEQELIPPIKDKSFTVALTAQWDGKNDAGVLLADGSYTYSVSAQLVRMKLEKNEKNEKGKEKSKDKDEDKTKVIGTTSAKSGTIVLDSMLPTLSLRADGKAITNGAVIANFTPQFQMDYFDDASGVNTVSFKLSLDGVDVTADAVVTPSNATCTPTSPLSGGTHSINVEIADNASNKAVLSSTFIIADAGGVIDSSGGVITVTNPNSTVFGASIIVPPNFVSSPVTLYMLLSPVSPPFPSSLIIQAGPIVEFGPSGMIFSGPVTLKVPYQTSLIPAGVSETALKLYYYDSVLQEWILIPDTSIDTAERLVIGGLTHFTPVVAGLPVVDPGKTTVIADDTILPADGISSTIITVVPKDANGQLLGSGQTVTLSKAGPGELSIVADRGDGRYIAYLFSTLEKGTTTITAVVNGVTITQTPEIVFTAVVDPDQTTITANPSYLPANGIAIANIIVTPRDSNGDPIGPGQTVILGKIGPGILETQAKYKNNGAYNGSYIGLIQATQEEGVAVIGASVNGVTISQQAVVTFGSSLTNADSVLKNSITISIYGPVTYEANKPFTLLLRETNTGTSFSIYQWQLLEDGNIIAGSGFSFGSTFSYDKTITRTSVEPHTYTFKFRPIGGAHGWPPYMEAKITVPQPMPEHPVSLADAPAYRNLGTAGDEINLWNGQCFISQTDISIPGRGLSVNFTRHYNSGYWYNGPLGQKWTHNYDISIERQENGDLILFWPGREGVWNMRLDTFVSPLGRKPADAELPLIYQSPDGLYETITENADHTFTRELRYGTKQYFNNKGRLIKIQDTAGNEINFGYNTYGLMTLITDPLGRQLTLTYGIIDGFFRITKITDWAGRTWRYEYAQENLWKATTPSTAEYPNGLTISYAYDSWHNLMALTDAKGQTYMSNYYDPMQGGGVTSQLYGEGAYQFDYSTPDTAIVTDRNNNVTEYGFNSTGNPLYKKEFTKGIYSGEPEYYLMQYEYNRHFEITKLILPEGNSEEYLYSDTEPDLRARGNLLERRIKSANPADPDIITTFTYEPRFNHVKSVRDPRGFETVFYFDYEEAAFGDLNGDGITSQAAGNVVKILYPRTTLPDNTAYTPEEYFRYNQYGQIISHTDPEGYVTAWEYFPAGDPSYGYVKSIIRDYSNAGEIDPKTGKPHLNLTYFFHYDTFGNVTGVTDGKGQLSSYEINAFNQITAVKSRPLTDAGGMQYSLESSVSYDENGSVKSVSMKNYDENGALYADMPYLNYDFTYDILDNLKTITAQSGPNKHVTMTYERDANENIIKTIMPEGNFNVSMYDERDLVYQAIAGADNPAEQLQTNYTYTLNGMLKSASPGNPSAPDYGRGAIRNFYDNYSRLYKVMDEINNYSEYVFDSAGFVRETRRVDDAGNVLSHSMADYDELGRADILTTNYFAGTEQGSVLPVITQIFMDKNGRTDKIIDAKNRSVFYQYDGIGRLIALLDEFGNRVEAEFDANSNPVRVTQTERDLDTGAEETFVNLGVFDPLDRLFQTIDNAGNIADVKYDGRSNVVWAKDREGNTILRKYDGLSRLTDTIYQMRQGGTGAGVIEKEITVSSVYDDNSRLIQQKDGKGNVTAFAYDSVNRMKTKILPDGTQQGYFFKPEGVLDYSIDANGTRATFGYDNALRLIHKDIQRGTGVEGTTYEDFWYDGANRLISAANDYSAVTRSYNSYSEITSETQTLTVDANTITKTVSSEFDILGNKTALNYPSGKRITYGLDQMDRVEFLRNSGQDMIAEYKYQGTGRVKLRKSGNGTQLDVAYDAMRRITQYQNNFVGTGQWPVLGIAGFEYGYNKEGMRTYEQYAPGAGEINQQARARVFTYDSLYQTTGVKYDVPDPIAELQNPGSQTYSKMVGYDFDNSGNRNSVETQNFASLPTVQNYQSNTLNQYITIDTSVFGYDQVGNMTQGVIYLDDLANPGQKTPVQARFVYDYKSELLRVERQNDGVILGEYVYDALGRRVYKSAWDRESSAYELTYFWYSGVECIEESDSTGQIIAVYAFGIGIDEAILVEIPQVSPQYPQSGTYWYHTDILGSAVAVTDNNGAVVERYKYDIYGEAVISASDGETLRAESAIGNRLLYTGREYDKETGLYCYRARYYHAQIGRFISADPAGSDELGNLFAYVSNSPANWTDPFGLVKKLIKANICHEQQRQDIQENLRKEERELIERMAQAEREASSSDITCHGRDSRGIRNNPGWGFMNRNFGDISIVALKTAVAFAMIATASVSGGSTLALIPAVFAAIETYDAGVSVNNIIDRETSENKEEPANLHSAQVVSHSVTDDPNARYWIEFSLGWTIAFAETYFAFKASLPNEVQVTKAEIEALRTPAEISAAKRTLLSSEIKPGMEINPSEVNIFRGGNSIDVRTIDVKFENGLVRPTQGISLQSNPAGLGRFGGAYRIESIPLELKVIQRGMDLGHFEIVPRVPMTIERFQELLQQVEMAKY